MFEEMLQGKMDNHLGNVSNDYGYKDMDNRCNGYTDKKLKTSYGDVPSRSPRIVGIHLTPQVVLKRTTDVVSIVDKVLSLYMRGMKQRDISSIEDIYVLPLLAEQISNITGRLLDNIHEWLDCLFSSWIAYTLISGVK